VTEAHPSVVLPGKRLGLRPKVDHDRPVLRLASYLKATRLPEHPVEVDHLGSIRFGLDKNDKFGTCGPTSLDNLRRLVTALLLGEQKDATWEDVKALYVLQNPGFDEETGAGDEGVDMQQMLTDAVRHGFAGEPVLGFAKVDLDDPEVVRAAVAAFGGVLLGLDLQVSQQDQLASGVWDYSRSSAWGGHAVMEGAYEPAGGDVETWAERVHMTPTFIQHQVKEAYAVILPAHLGSRRFLDAVDLAAYAADWEQITGRAFPAPIPTTPPGGGGASFRVELPAAQAALVRARAARQKVTPEALLARYVAHYLGA
jgi:hypothetical protein